MFPTNLSFLKLLKCLKLVSPGKTQPIKEQRQHWKLWGWAFNNLAVVFFFWFCIVGTVKWNSIKMYSEVSCSIFYSLHYVFPAGPALTGLGWGTGLRGAVLKRQPLNWMMSIPQESSTTEGLQGYKCLKCFIVQGLWMLQRSAFSSEQIELFERHFYLGNHSFTADI